MLGTALLLLVALLAVSVPVAAVMGVLGLALNQFFSSIPLYLAMGDIVWNASSEYILIAIPMFVMLGEILLRSGIAHRVYAAIATWLSWLPGGLMHANIGTCAMFAATSGSSVATAATVGVVALPQVKIRRYDEPLFLGTLAAGGTLGILIPPSINFILYGLLTQTSVPRLYLAGMIPGLLLTSLFMAIILLYCLIWPAKGGTRVESSWRERLGSLKDLVAPLFIFGVVVGSIYAGWATPTESAALGVIGALVLAAAHRALTLDMLKLATESTIRVTGMAMLVLLAAFFLSFVISILGINRDILAFVQGLELTPLQLMIAIIAFYIVLGCFLDPLTMMVTTIPIVAPLVASLGYDLIWFGILIVVLCEMALITPPFGVNLFVVQAIRRRGMLTDVIIGAAPFALTLMALIVMLVIWPPLAMFGQN